MPPDDLLAAGWREAVDAFLFDWADDHDVPSVAAALVDRTGERHAVVHGACHLADNRSATPDTLYPVGSVTKSVTATAVMRLVERDHLDLEASPAAYLDLAVEGIESISLHDLLTHTSGWPSFGIAESLIAQQLDRADPAVPVSDSGDLRQVLAGAGDYRSDRDRWMYCNTGYVLLAEVVAAVSGRPFDAVVEADILAPLGMDRSTMVAADFVAADDRATPYRRDDADERWEATPVPVRDLSRGPGGLFTSVRELGRYLRLYLGDGRAPDGTDVLEPASIARMTDAHAQTPAGPYGYGWRRVNVDGEALIGHGGSVAVSTAYAGWLPDHDLGIALACNAAPGHGLRLLGQAVVAVAMGTDPWETHGYFRKRRRQRRLEGPYTSHGDIRTATVTPAAGRLELCLDEPLPGEPMALVHDGTIADGHRYLAPTDDDGTMEVLFVEEDGRLTLYFDRWRMRRRDRTGEASA